MKDWRNTPIEVGSKVVYPSRTGSHLYVVEADVVDVLEEKDRWSDKLVPVLRVRPVRETGYGKPNVLEDAKTVKLTAVQRVTVVA